MTSLFYSDSKYIQKDFFGTFCCYACFRTPSYPNNCVCFSSCLCDVQVLLLPRAWIDLFLCKSDDKATTSHTSVSGPPPAIFWQMCMHKVARKYFNGKRRCFKWPWLACIGGCDADLIYSMPAWSLESSRTRNRITTCSGLMLLIDTASVYDCTKLNIMKSVD